MITGKTLIDWGFNPKGKGKWFGGAIEMANRLRSEGYGDDSIRGVIRRSEPQLPPEIPLRTNAAPFNVFLEPENDAERDNLKAVVQKMDELLRVPTAVSGVVLPDACPTGDMPVGTVIATKDAIHPGFHSADVCCSMAITVLEDHMHLSDILNAAMNITHFGPGSRKKDPFQMSTTMVKDFAENKFLADAVELGHSNLGTQGDGNHFLYVGRLRSTGQPAIVTHHGSRGVGALVYKRGMAIAKKHTALHSPNVPDKSSWIDATSEDGIAYLEALQIVRRWTESNHFLLHNAINNAVGGIVSDRFWNEHNFVFRRADGLYYHAKGATPSFQGFSPDDDGRTLIPMNMAEPILITEHTDRPEALGFAPHGAGRNMSRTSHMKLLSAGDPRGLSPRDRQLQFEKETKGLDIRSYFERHDLSELPSAYKSAEQVQRQIKKHSLAHVVDYVDPYGSIMAGELIWDKRKKGK